MGKTQRDGWLIRRVMRLTPLEKRAVNSPSHAQRTAAVAKDLLEHVTLPPQPRCLEIGCGQGALARLLVEHLDAQAIATDFDSDQVALARERLTDLGDRVTFQVVDARTLPFEDGQFDAAFSFGVMHHIHRGWRDVAAEVGRVLKRTGVFVFTDFYLPSWSNWLMRTLFPRFDQLEYGPLWRCLNEHGLTVTYQAWERHALGFLRYGKSVAQRRETIAAGVSEVQ